MQGLDIQVLEKIQDTAVRAAGAKDKVEILQPKPEPSHVYLAVTADGKFERFEAAPAARRHVLESLDEVSRFVKEKGSVKTVVWYNEAGVVVVLDDETRRDIATLTFSETPQFSLLRELEVSKSSLDQKAFRRLLKIDLAGCRRDDRLLNWISSVKWSSTKGAFGNFSNSKESMGRDLDEAAFSEAGEFPDEHVLNIRVYSDPALIEPCGIKCAAEIDFPNPAFRLTPLPMELDNAVDLQLHFIGNKLRGELGDDEGANVFQGKP